MSNLIRLFLRHSKSKLLHYRAPQMTNHSIFGMYFRSVYKIREKCRKTDRKLRKILNLVHKSQAISIPADSSDEKAKCKVIPPGDIISVSEELTLNEESDVLEEPALDIKSELLITSPFLWEELLGSPNPDQVDSEANYPAVESPDPSSNQETVDYAETNPELTESPLILVKQEEVQPNVPINGSGSFL